MKYIEIPTEPCMPNTGAFEATRRRHSWPWLMASLSRHVSQNCPSVDDRTGRSRLAEYIKYDQLPVDLMDMLLLPNHRTAYLSLNPEP